MSSAAGKLVLFLADGTTLHIPFDHERLTVGRRPGNDVCLPYPTVSGTHAAFATTPDGVVMEDLGSTNGTVINGMRTTRHLLRDGDRVDIGRQHFVYFADPKAVVPPRPRRGGGAGVERERADVPIRAESREATASPFGPATTIDVRSARTERGTVPRLPPARGVGPAEPESGVQQQVHGQSEAAATASDGGGEAREPEAAAVPIDLDHALDRELAHLRSQPGTVAGSEAGTEGTQPVTVPSLKVLTGPNMGRVLPLVQDEAMVGRVGFQVAVVRKEDARLVLALAEGKQPPRVNGVAVPGDGTPLQPGDVIEIAGAQLVFVGPEAPALA